MFSHLTRFNLFLIFLSIIALRLVVGYHFYKEGVNKIQYGFDAQYFLKGAKGPFKNYFLSMTDDANGRLLLGITETLDKKGNTDYKIDDARTAAIWDDFVEQATNYYGFGSPELIEQIEKDIADRQKIAESDDDSGLRAQEYIADLKLQIEEIKSQPERVAEALGAHQAELKDWLAYNRVAVLAWYRTGIRLKGFERDGEARDRVASDVDSLRGQVDKIEIDRNKELTNWKSQLSAIWDSLETQVNAMAVSKQVRETGPLPLHRPYAQTNSKHAMINKIIPWFDITVGVLLLLGLFTRWASLAAGIFLLSVCLTQPFWIQGAAPTYYQAIEMVACFVLFAVHAGRFGGLDYFFTMGRRPTEVPAEPAVQS